MAEPADLGAITVYRDTDWSYQILAQTGTPPVAVDLTVFGTVWTAEARTSVASTTPIVITVDASQAAVGLITLSMPVAVTATLPTYLGFDVFAAPSSGPPVNAVWKGKFIVEGAFTHA